MTTARVGKGSPKAAKIQQGVQAVPPRGRSGTGRTGSSFGTTNQGRKAVTSVPTQPTKKAK